MTGKEHTAVCFDLDYTLVGYDRPFDEIVREALSPALDTVSDAAIERMLVRMGDALDEREEDAYRLAAAAACEEAGLETGGETNGVDLDAIEDRLRTAEFEGTSVADPVRETLTMLAADDAITVCVITDGHDEWQRAKLAHHGIDEYVAEVVTSYDAGGSKESGAPYEYLRERVAADEYVMIGDDYAADVEAARAAGFVPIHYEETDGPDFFATLQAML